MKRQAKCGKQPPEKHYVAEAVAALYGSKWGETPVGRFRQEVERYRTRFRKRNQLDWMVYVLRLVLTCPVLLERLPGLECVVEDLQWFLNHRRIHKDVDRDFWMALAEARKFPPAGKPVSRGRDFMRYQLIHAMMNPVTTDPEEGVVRVNGMTKTEAVAEMAEMEGRHSGTEVSVRGIYRSLEWVEKISPHSRHSWNKVMKLKAESLELRGLVTMTSLISTFSPPTSSAMG
jgi:hypothetical protein